MGALRLSAGGGFGAGALALSWGWLGQFGVEEGTFGSTVTVGRWGGHSLEGCGGSGSDALAMYVSWCYQTGYVRVLYQGDWGTCGTGVCLVGRVMLVS